VTGLEGSNAEFSNDQLPSSAGNLLRYW
jgi:hypothetical protein